MAHCSRLPYVPLFFSPLAQFQSSSFLFLEAEDVCGGVARDCITSFRPDQFWFSMGYDFVFYCIRIGRLFRTSLSFSLHLSLAVLIFVCLSQLAQYLYALLSTPSDSQTECHGTHCFRVTFIVCAVSCFVGGLGIWLLGRRWKV